MVNLAKFIKLCLEDHRDKFLLLLQTKVITFLVDLIDPRLTISDEFVCEVLITSVLNNLLYRVGKGISKNCDIKYLLARFIMRAMNVSLLLLDLIVSIKANLFLIIRRMLLSHHLK